MGFSLKRFFEVLQEMLQNAKSEEDLDEIRTFVVNNKSYAEDCGQLK